MRKAVLYNKLNSGFNPCSIKTFNTQVHQLNQIQNTHPEKAKIQAPLKQLKSIKNQQDILMPLTQNNSFDELVDPIPLDELDKLRGGNSRAFLMQTKDNIISVSFEKKLKQQISCLFIEKEPEQEIDQKQKPNLKNFQLFNVFSNIIGEQLNDSNEI